MKNQQGFIPLMVIVAAGIIGTSGVTVAASQASLPGDALYPVKKVTENVRVATAFTKQDKVKVHLAIAEEKVKEIEKLEEKGAADEQSSLADKIAEAAQELEESQDKALELTQDIKSEGQKVDELVELLEVQSGKQQVVLTKISNNIPQQISESLAKSLEQFREQLKVTVESDEGEQEEADSENPSQTPCPSPSSSEDEDQDVQGVSQLRNSQSSSFSRDPCDSAEGYSGAGSQTFDGGAGSSNGIEGDGVSPGGDQGGQSVGAPTSDSPDVEGVSTTDLLQLILNIFFQPQK